MRQEKGVGWTRSLAIGVFVIALMFAIGVGITGNSIFGWFYEEEPFDEGPQISGSQYPHPGKQLIEPTCGNGGFEVGETCDDCNLNSSDGCSSTCQIEYCGDGIVQAGLGEVCDKGSCGVGQVCATNCRTCINETSGNHVPRVQIFGNVPTIINKGSATFVVLLTDQDGDMKRYTECGGSTNPLMCKGGRGGGGCTPWKNLTGNQSQKHIIILTPSFDVGTQEHVREISILVEDHKGNRGDDQVRVPVHKL